MSSPAHSGSSASHSAAPPTGPDPGASAAFEALTRAEQAVRAIPVSYTHLTLPTKA